MSKTQEYLSRIRAVHGDRYDLSKISEVRNDKQLVDMGCPEHGWFTTSLNKVIHRKKGCPTCGKEARAASKTSNKARVVIDEFREVHGNQYDYSLVEYRGDKEKVKIICPKHGEFEQTPGNHKQGFGCRRCGVAVRDALRKATVASGMVSAFRMAHGDRYDYSESVYSGSKEKVKIICPKHGEFEQTFESHVAGKGCRRCGSKGANFQKFVTGMLDGYGVAYEENNRSTLLNSETGRYREIDILLPDCSLGVELHGLVYHSEIVKEGFELKELHRWKFEESLKRGVTLLQFFEDEVRLRPEVVRRTLLHKLGLSSDRVFARKCSVRRLSASEKGAARKFLEENHLQGSSLSLETYTLVLEDEVVAVMNFNGITSERGVKFDGTRWELTRFASRNVVGAASRLLSAFLADHPEARYLCSYSDNRISSGAVYESLGFDLEGEVPPQYCYIHNDEFRVVEGKKVHVRIHKSSLRKDRQLRLLEGYDPSLSEHENALAHGFYRVYDAGKRKWSVNLS